MPEAVALVLLLAPTLVIPHALPLARVTPAAAAGVWLAALALRALLVVGFSLSTLLLLPATPLFGRVSGWSAHQMFGSLHVDLSGEPVAHVAALGPPVVLAISLIAFAVALGRGALMVRAELSRRALGPGPHGSVVIADRTLMVAVPGVGRGRILLSHAALAELDPAELEACLAHEAAHLRRLHRPLGLMAACMAVAARPLPGSRAAELGLRLSLERDADEDAVARTGDPLALASAICKVAGAQGGRPPGHLAFGLDGGGAARARLDGLLAGGTRRGSARLERTVLLLGVSMSLVAGASAVAMAVSLLAMAPSARLAAALACA